MNNTLRHRVQKIMSIPMQMLAFCNLMIQRSIGGNTAISGLKIHRLRLRWRLLIVCMVALTMSGGAAWIISNGTPSVQAAVDTPSVRAVSSAVVRYTETSKIINRPTTEQGDILLLFLAADSGVQTGTVLPAGFTEIGRRSLGTDRVTYLAGYKVATGSEPATYTFTTTQYADAMYSLTSIQNADTTDRPAITNADTPGSTSTHSTPQIKPYGSNDLLISSAVLDSLTPAILGPSTTWTPPPSMTERVDLQVLNMMSMTMASETLTNGGDTGVRTFATTATSANPGLAYSIAIKGKSDAKTQIVPNSSTSTGTTSWGIYAHGSIDEGTALDTLYASTGTTNANAVVTYGMSDLTTVEEGTGLRVYFCAHSATDANGGLLDTLTMDPKVNTISLGVATVTPAYTTTSSQCTWYGVSYNGYWTKERINGLQITLTRTVQGSGGNASRHIDDVRVQSMYVDVIHPQASVGTGVLTATPTIRGITSANERYTVVNKSITKPTVQQGDLLIAIFAADYGLMKDMALPEGFTEIGWLDKGYHNMHVKIGTKVATSSEPSSYSYVAPTDADTRFDMISVQGADTSITPVVTKYLTPLSDSIHVAPSVNPLGSNDLMLSTVALSYLPTLGTTSWTPPADMTERSDLQIGNLISMTTASKALTSGASSGLKTFTASPVTSITQGATFSLAVKGVTVQPAQEQSSYRFYDTEGVPMEAQNTPIAVALGTSFKLRQLLRQTQAMSSTTDSFKLQVGEKASTCSAATYTDLTAAFDTDFVGQPFADDFTFADTTKWTGYNSYVSVADGQLKMTRDYMTSGSSNLVSNEAFDMTNQNMHIEMVTENTSAADNGFELHDSANPGHRLALTTSGANYLTFTQYVNGGWNSQTGGGLAHDPILHRYIRIRLDAQKAYWEMSPDAINWTEYGQLTLAIPSVTSMKAAIFLRHGSGFDSGAGQVWRRA